MGKNERDIIKTLTSTIANNGILSISALEREFAKKYLDSVCENVLEAIPRDFDGAGFLRSYDKERTPALVIMAGDAKRGMNHGLSLLDEYAEKKGIEQRSLALAELFADRSPEGVRYRESIHSPTMGSEMRSRAVLLATRDMAGADSGISCYHSWLRDIGELLELCGVRLTTDDSFMDRERAKFMSAGFLSASAALREMETRSDDILQEGAFCGLALSASAQDELTGLPLFSVGAFRVDGDGFLTEKTAHLRMDKEGGAIVYSLESSGHEDSPSKDIKESFADYYERGSLHALSPAELLPEILFERRAPAEEIEEEREIITLKQEEAQILNGTNAPSPAESSESPADKGAETPFFDGI